MPRFSIELRETKTYQIEGDFRDKEEAESTCRALAHEHAIEPETMEIDCDVFAAEWCEHCGLSHFGPTCPKPPQSVTMLPRDERREA